MDLGIKTEEISCLYIYNTYLLDKIISFVRCQCITLLKMMLHEKLPYNCVKSNCYIIKIIIQDSLLKFITLILVIIVTSEDKKIALKAHILWYPNEG